MSHFASSQILSRLPRCDLSYPISAASCHKNKEVGVKCYHARIIRLLKFKPEREES